MKELKDFTDEEALKHMMEEEKKSELEGTERWARMNEQQRLFFRIVAFNFNQYCNSPFTSIAFEKQGFSEEEASKKSDEYYYNWYIKEFGVENLKYYYRMPIRYRNGIHKDLVFDNSIRFFNYKEL
jgi:hypothetical protein